MKNAPHILNKNRRILSVLASGKYTVTPEGRIFNNSHRNTGERRELAYFKDKNGYTLVYLRGLRIVRLSRVVALLFIGNHNNCLWVNHKNGNIADDRVENIEWGTPVETVEKAARRGTRHDQRWEGNNGRKLSVESVRKIRKLLNFRRWSQQKIANLFGVAQSTISSVARKKTWGADA